MYFSGNLDFLENEQNRYMFLRGSRPLVDFCEELVISVASALYQIQPDYSLKMRTGVQDFRNATGDHCRIDILPGKGTSDHAGEWLIYDSREGTSNLSRAKLCKNHLKIGSKMGWEMGAKSADDGAGYF